MSSTCKVGKTGDTAAADRAGGAGPGPARLGQASQHRRRDVRGGGDGPEWADEIERIPLDSHVALANSAVANATMGEALGVLGQELDDAAAVGKFLLDVGRQMPKGEDLETAVLEALRASPIPSHALIVRLVHDAIACPRDEWDSPGSGAMLAQVAKWAHAHAQALEQTAAILSRVAAACPRFEHQRQPGAPWRVVPEPGSPATGGRKT